MSLNPKWVPMKWPCGPLEIARLNQFNSGDEELKKAAETWAQPSSLQWLKGTPINCLVVDWALGTVEDESQQKALKPLIQAGRELGLSFVGRISVQENLAAAVTAGRAAGLEAVMLKAPANHPLDLPVILQLPNDGVQWDLTTPIFATAGNVWPGSTLKATDENMDGDPPVAGPTGNPWVDSNGWLSLLAREMAPKKVLWLEIDLPDAADLLPADKYCLAVADSQVYGSRWIVSLDNGMRLALLKKDSSAMKTWTRICDTISFFESHAEWQTYDPMAVLAIVSDFSGQNEYTNTELLNLLNRRQIQFLVMNRTHGLSSTNSGLKGILWLDEEVPNVEQLNPLLAFVRQGGMVIAAKYWGPKDVMPAHENWLFGYNIYNVGKGKIVVADGGFPDPYQLARDVHLLVSRKNDFVRVYNPGVTKYYSSIDSQRRKQIVQLLNYSADVATYMTLWVDTKAQSAKLWSPEPLTSLSMKNTPANEGTNFDLPPLPVNCAVEIDRRT
jgi:hypothetical protein